MKNLAVLLISIICFSTYASNEAKADDGNATPNGRLKEYKHAVEDVLYDADLECKVLTGSSLSYTQNSVGSDIRDATSIHINDAGLQPLITFNKNWTRGIYQRITIKTSADYKSILSVLREEFYLVTVNKGDLRNPNFVKENQLSYREICEQQK